MASTSARLEDYTFAFRITVDLFCEDECEDDVEVEEKADEREQGEDQA